MSKMTATYQLQTLSNTHLSPKTPKQGLPLIMEHNLPPALLVDALPISARNIVANNLNLARLGPNKMRQKRTDNRFHPTTQHDHRYIVLSRPLEELLEAHVELDVL